jgi:hypothetical protein
VHFLENLVVTISATFRPFGRSLNYSKKKPLTRTPGGFAGLFCACALGAFICLGERGGDTLPHLGRATTGLRQGNQATAGQLTSRPRLAWFGQNENENPDPDLSETKTSYSSFFNCPEA